jgi:hypothetical protein
VNEPKIYTPYSVAGAPSAGAAGSTTSGAGAVGTSCVPTVEPSFASFCIKLIYVLELIIILATFRCHDIILLLIITCKEENYETHQHNINFSFKQASQDS